MNKSLNTEKVEQTEKRFLNLSADRLDLIKAFGLLVQRDSDTARINPNAYQATLTAGNHSFTEVTRC